MVTFAVPATCRILPSMRNSMHLWCYQTRRTHGSPITRNSGNRKLHC